MVNIVKREDPPAQVITHDVEPLTVNTDAKAYARLGWIIVLAGVLGFVLWAVFAPLDKGVPVSGTVATESSRKTVQYQPGGIVQDILVKDGDQVKAGQTLVRMNNVTVKSALEISVVQYIAARATEARLMAELTGQTSIKLPATLEKYKDDPRTRDNMLLQQQLFTSRQSALRSELGGVEESIAGLEFQVKGLQDSLAAKKEQQVLLKEQLDNTRDLSKDGYIARNRMLELERTYSQINGAISEDIGNIGHYKRQIVELNLRKSQRSQEYQRDVRTQLADVQKEADALQSRLAQQDFELANADVKAPVDGVVVGSAVFTRGGVVGAGQKMMEIVPTEDALVVEGQLPVNLIDKVHPGLPVELIFAAFNSNKTPHIPGQVIQVGADRAIDEHTGTPYYKVRARVSKEGLALMDKKKMDVVPGMPVEMFVKTGERTMMSYLLKPVFDRSKSSMTEE